MRTLQRYLWTVCASSALAFGLFVVQPAAQTRPANATAQCKDGTFSTAKSKRGACSAHGGVETWFADADAKSAAKDAKHETKAAAKSTKRAGKSAAKSAKESGESVGSAAKDVGKSAARAGKDVGRSATQGAKGTAGTAKEGGRAVANSVKPRPSDAPQDATAKCKDGTYSHAKQHRGACANHGGVAEWYR